MATTNIDKAISKYEYFINDVLKEDLQQQEIRLNGINQEIADLIQQRHSLKLITNKETHPTGFKVQVNIGCNFFMEGSVTDTSSLIMNIGLNNYLEFSLQEANRYLDARIEAFERIARELRDKSASTKAHIKLMLLAISELQSGVKS